jgi:Flp pilus assembly protein TadD
VADITMSSGHVNLVLARLAPRLAGLRFEPDDLTIDFLPSNELRGQRTQPLAERTIVAMYLNNRAAESLADGHLDDSYAFARAAMLQDPSFNAAANTLAVIYLRSGHLPEAETTLRHVLAREPESASALSNLVVVLQRAGRADEAAAAYARLRDVQPYAPFHFYELGRRAMEAGDYSQAREHFAVELRRQPYQSEVHFWAALADWRLGDNERAARHLRLAAENSSTPQAQQLYTAKLDRLRALSLQ